MRTSWILLTGWLVASCGVTEATADRETSYSIDPDTAVIAEEEDDDDEGEETEELVELALVPAAAKAAALAAVPGLVLEEAENEGGGVYCLHGTADGVFTEVEVDSSGKVLEIEQGPDDDD